MQAAGQSIQRFGDAWRRRLRSWVELADGWRNSRLLFPVALATVCGGLFLDCIGPHTVFAYRDAAHFYPPLYALVKSEWLHGRVPLWNPLLNAGQPLAGTATSGCFYPPQVLLTLLFPAPLAVTIYAISHLAVAAAGGYALGRLQRLSQPAATVAGLAYGFSGSVLFQVYNPIYAAGAAWLAWGVVAGWWLVNGGGVRAGVALAMALSLAVLAGDPQAAYHAGLVLGAVVLLLGRPVFGSMGRLLAAAGLGGLMALTQIALASEFFQETTRSLDFIPQSVWQLPGFFARPESSVVDGRWFDIFIGRAPAAASHYRETYSFQLVPWRFIEAVWPGFSGALWSRWTMVAGLEPDLAWVASIYAGLMAVVLAWAALGDRRPDKLRRLWLVVAGVSLVAACGGYLGIGIGRNALLLVTGRGHELGFVHGDEVGSVYWWLTTFLPGYSGFRYPAKWLTVFSLALGQIAGWGFDRLDDAAFRRRAATLAGWFGILVGIGLAGGLILFAADWPYRYAPTAAILGGVQALVAAACIRACLRFRSGAAIPLLVVVMADLVAAGRPELVVGDHRDLVQGGSYLRVLLRERLPGLEGVSPQMRVAVFDSDKPLEPLGESSRRYLGSLGTTQVTHAPWLFGCGVIGDRGTAMPADMEMLRQPILHSGTLVQPRRFYDLAGVELFVIANVENILATSDALANDWSAKQAAGRFEGLLPLGGPLLGREYRLPGVDEGPAMVHVLRNASALPRVRIVRNAVIVPEVSRSSQDQWIELLRRIAFPNPVLTDLVNQVVIEGDPQAVLPCDSLPEAAASRLSDGCRITTDESQRVVVEATMAAPGLVVLADSFHPDWSLSVTTDDGPAHKVPILRANRLHRACRLPAGSHRLEFRYRSPTFSRTIWVSVVAWLAAISVYLLPTVVRRSPAVAAPAAPRP